MKKITLILSTIALLLCFAFSVSAAGENAQKAVPIKLNETLVASLNEDNYEYYFKFTPSKTAFYEFSLAGNGFEDAEPCIWDKKGEIVALSEWNQYTNTNIVAGKLKANNTYYFEIEYWGHSKVSLSTTVKTHSHSYEIYDVCKATEDEAGYIEKECSVCETITKTKIPKVVISLSKDTFVYNGKKQQPTVTVKDTTGKVFKKGTDYTVKYPKKSVDADYYEISVVMKNSKYDVSAEIEYSIDEIVLNKSNVKLSKTSIPYEDNPTISIVGLKEDTDYISVVDCYSVGVGKIMILGIGNYTGTVNKTFKVIPPNISGLKASRTNTSSIKLSWKYDSEYETDYYQIYDVSQKKIVKTIDSENTSYTIKKLKPGKKYSFKVRGYSKVDGEKYYGQWKTIEAATNPKGTTIKSAKSSKSKVISLVWNKQSAATGYQIQYSTSNKFTTKTTKTLTIKKNTEISKNISKLTGGKKYYVKIRTYKAFKLNNKSVNVYSAWSETKSATIKK